jgi:putative YphP/YqiW family bacilliredoxin
MYPELMVIPMREELVRAGIKETRTAEEVDAALAEPGTTLVVVNSICGCAAGKARPAIRLALSHSANLPDRKITVFAGQDREATERARSYFEGHPPSSPSVAILRDGKLVNDALFALFHKRPHPFVSFLRVRISTAFTQQLLDLLLFELDHFDTRFTIDRDRKRFARRKLINEFLELFPSFKNVDNPHAFPLQSIRYILPSIGKRKHVIKAKRPPAQEGRCFCSTISPLSPLSAPLPAFATCCGLRNSRNK